MKIEQREVIYMKHVIPNLKNSSKHASFYRENRLSKALELNNRSKAISTFVVDRNHRDGQEFHVITENAIVFIFNKRKYEQHSPDCFITVLIARPGQIKRYYDAIGRTAPEDVLNAARTWQKAGYNKI